MLKIINRIELHQFSNHHHFHSINKITRWLFRAVNTQKEQMKEKGIKRERKREAAVTCQKWVHYCQYDQCSTCMHRLCASIVHNTHSQSHAFHISNHWNYAHVHLHTHTHKKLIPKQPAPNHSSLNNCVNGLHKRHWLWFKN